MKIIQHTFPDGHTYLLIDDGSTGQTIFDLIYFDLVREIFNQRCMNLKLRHEIKSLQEDSSG